MKLKWIGTLGLLVMALGLTGCWTTGSGGSGPASNVACSLDELRLGDMVTMTFADVPPPGIAEQKVRVKEDGTLSLPQNLSVLAAGKKIGIVEKEIVALFVPKYYRQLTVTLRTDDRTYSVGGEVKMPGRQGYFGPTTVLRAIQSCGDFTDFAKQTKVQIQRANGTLEIVNCKAARTKPKLDVPICPGDSIHVPRRTF